LPVNCLPLTHLLQKLAQVVLVLTAARQGKAEGVKSLQSLHQDDMRRMFVSTNTQYKYDDIYDSQDNPRRLVIAPAEVAVNSIILYLTTIYTGSSRAFVPCTRVLVHAHTQAHTHAHTSQLDQTSLFSQSTHPVAARLPLSNGCGCPHQELTLSSTN
jgi:hypothetical protein